MTDELKNVDLSALKETATELTSTTQQPQVQQRPVIKDDDFRIVEKQGVGLALESTPTNNQDTHSIQSHVISEQSPTEGAVGPIPAEYDGPGLVIEHDPSKKPLEKLPKIDSVPRSSMDNVSKYLNETMEQDIEEAKKAAELRKQQLEEQQKESGVTIQKDTEQLEHETQDAFNEAIVIIDKIGMGSVQFTDEERAKMEQVKKISVHEVSNINLQTIKTKKPKKANVENILKRKSSVHNTPIVNPASGYTAVVKGCSTYELISLSQNNDNTLIDAEQKWSLIHDKTVSTSLGDLTFNDFLKSTASTEYNNFIYAILAATYPEDDKLPLNCLNPKCGKEFEHKYSIRSLIRVEKMGDKLKENVAKTIDGSHTLESAQETHKNSPLNTIKRIVLPECGFIFDLHIQSAYDLIYTSIKGLADNKENKYNQASIFSTSVHSVYIADDESENEDEYLEFSDAMDITKIIYSLGSSDFLILAQEIEKLNDDLTFEYGLMNVKCPHCGHFTETVVFDIESILFYRHQQALTTKVE